MMSNKLLSLALAYTIITFLGCSREYYQTAAYDDYAPKHQTIAVLPSQIITTGRIPEEWSPEMIEQIETNESSAFQVAIFDEIAERSGTEYKDISINLQHYSETNALLDNAGITIKDSWKMAPTKLAQVLGVDAVIRTSIRKDMFLTELESFGVSIATTAISILGGEGLWFLTNKTSDVFLSASILDSETGTAIWVTDKKTETNWNDRHSEIVRNLARMMARRFPYRR